MKTIVITGLACLVCFRAAFSQTVPPQAAGYNVVFSEDFTQFDLSPDGSGAHTWYPGIYFQPDKPTAGSITVDNSILDLQWKRGNANYNTSMEDCSNDASHCTTFRYGYFEAQMKWDVTAGNWPAFWMITKQSILGVQNVGELDIFEGQGNDPTHYYGTINTWSPAGLATSNSPYNNRFQLPSDNDYSQWHTYGLLWVPGTVTWYYDNQAVGTAQTSPLFDQQDFFMILGSQEGHNWTPGNLAGVSAQLLNLDVKWVHVFQAQSTQPAPSPAPPTTTQQPACTVNLGEPNQQFTAVGGSASLIVSAAAGCSWTATSNAPWITFASARSGIGNGVLDYTASLNSTTLPRTGTITVGDQTETIAQVAMGLRFVPVYPCRIVDTRNPDGPFGGPKISGRTFRDFTVPGSACGIPTNAQAYAINVAVVPTAHLGYITLWPAGEAQPLVATLNSTDGRVKANAAIVAAGLGGAISVYSTDDTQLVMDIGGYFVPASDSSALAFYPLSPCRVADTRLSLGLLGQPSVGAQQVRNFPILLSNCNIPAASQAYSLNFSVVPKGGILRYISVWPTGQPQPLISTINDEVGTIVANAALVAAGINGDVSVYATEAADVIIDINGYFAPPQPGGLSLYTLPPCRVLDTRATIHGQPFSGTLTAAIQTGNSCAVPSQAQSYVLNATVVPPTRFGYLTLFAAGAEQPVVSTLNAVDGAITSNMAIVPTNNGSIDTYATHPTHLVLDLSGYFAP